MPQVIPCKSSKKPLAHIENGVLYLYCKQCRKGHPVTKEELLKLLEQSKSCPTKVG